MRSFMPYKGNRAPQSEKAPADIVVRLNADPTGQLHKYYFDSWIHHGSWETVKAQERIFLRNKMKSAHMALTTTMAITIAI